YLRVLCRSAARFGGCTPVRWPVSLRLPPWSWSSIMASSSTLLTLLQAAPVSVSIGAACCVIWFVIWNWRFDIAPLAVSYNAVVVDRQLYRAVTACFVHGGILHLVFNMTSLYAISGVEAAAGSYFYTKTTLLLLLVAELVSIALVSTLARWWGMTSALEQRAVGYSGILFGWSAIIAKWNPTAQVAFMGLIPMPAWVSPFASLFLIQLLVPNASFVGHLSGIIAGFLIAFNAFAWLTGYWFWTLVAWMSVACLLSLKAHPAVRMSWLQLHPSLMPASAPGTTAAAPVTRYMDANGILHVADSIDIERGLPVAPIPAAASTGAAGNSQSWRSRLSGWARL
ncbi:MAG: rhomboid family intramembrane serine protease, partial [Methanosarcinales archaeon]